MMGDHVIVNVLKLRSRQTLLNPPEGLQGAEALCAEAERAKVRNQAALPDGWEFHPAAFAAIGNHKGPACSQYLHALEDRRRARDGSGAKGLSLHILCVLDIHRANSAAICFANHNITRAKRTAYVSRRRARHSTRRDAAEARNTLYRVSSV